MKKTARVMLTAVALTPAMVAAQDHTTITTSPQTSDVLAESKVNGLTYRKVLGADGRVIEKIADSFGNDVTSVEQSKPSVAPPVIRDSLRQQIAQNGSGPVRVIIRLRDDVTRNIPLESGQAAGGSASSVSGTFTLNGKFATASDIEKANATRQSEVLDYRTRRSAKRRDVLSQLVARRGLTALTKLNIDAVAADDGVVVVEAALEELTAFAANNSDLLHSVELLPKSGTTTLATAEVVTGVNPGILGQPTMQGSGVGIWQIEDACPPAGTLTNYTRVVSGSDSNHSRNVAGIVRTVSPSSWIYCDSDVGGAGFGRPTAAQLGGISGHPAPRIITESYGWFTGDYEGIAADHDDYVLNNFVTYFAAAGNEGQSGTGASQGPVRAPATGLNVSGVGNYVDTDTSEHWAGTSSMIINPTSSFRDPANTHHNKPEFSGPGTTISAGTTTTGATPNTMTGTSQATPHLAAIAADLTQAMGWLTLRPQLIRPLFINNAIDGIAGGFNSVGYGGVDAQAAAYNHNDYWWDGNNGDWTNTTNNDGTPNDGALTINVSVTAGNYNAVAIHWLTSGTYTNNHLSDPHPIGADFDLRICTPGATQCWSSGSYDNPQEAVNFWAPVSGTYVIYITRFSNRDTSTPIHLGMVHKYW